MFQSSLSMSRAVTAPARASVSRRSAGFRTVTSANARVDKCSKKDIIVSPSILSANFAKLGEQARAARGRARGRGGPEKPAALNFAGRLLSKRRRRAAR
jgi:hypothetical protein